MCGIFILNGQMVEISRNHVVEARDWNLTSSNEAPSGGGPRGGIVVVTVTPPAFTTPASLFTNLAGAESTPLSYEPGLPALRVPLGEALEAFGFGPFSIVNHHLSCGGTVKAAGRPLAETVLIANLGTALEVANPAGKFTAVTNGKHLNPFVGVSRRFAGSPGGAVIFTNNICELEAMVSERKCFSSVMVFSGDDLIFANNQCWLDGPRKTAFFDAWLLAGSLQLTGNRFQEALGFPVWLSGLTLGHLNITTQNISPTASFQKALCNRESTPTTLSQGSALLQG